MFGRFRNALYTAMGSSEEGSEGGGGSSGGSGSSNSLLQELARLKEQNRRESSHTSVDGALSSIKQKYAYQRPLFLQLVSEDEIQVTADHVVRPIIVPRDLYALPWFAGYAEAINAGKSVRNEDQASVHRGVLCTADIEEKDKIDHNERREEFALPYTIFAMFDGHAGAGCAVAAANELHKMIHARLLSVLSHLIPSSSSPSMFSPTSPSSSSSLWFSSRNIDNDSLVIGALEAAFADMDTQIGEDKCRYRMLGGCTVLVSLFFLGKVYVANAGDSRAVMCSLTNGAKAMSFDFTPVSERQRLQKLAALKPQLLGNEYSHLDYSRRPMRKDLGKKLLVRQPDMIGWAYKEISAEDLRFPVVYGEGKRSRLLATIGVTRGFGDHDLRAQSQHLHHPPILIKPFLSPQPEVRVLNIDTDIGDEDVLIMATDGLWDVVSNEKVAEIVDKGRNAYSISEEKDERTRWRYKYISIAQDLVMAARGKLQERAWIRSDGSQATIDDISVFAIPLKGYKEECEDKRNIVAKLNSNEDIDSNKNLGLTNGSKEDNGDLDDEDEDVLASVSVVLADTHISDNDENKVVEDEESVLQEINSTLNNV